jgi:hypothetical protein
MYGLFASLLTAYTTVSVFKATTTSVNYLQMPENGEISSWQPGPEFEEPPRAHHDDLGTWQELAIGSLTFRVIRATNFSRIRKVRKSVRVVPSCPVRTYPARLARPSCFSGPARLVRPKHVYLMKFTCCAVRLTTLNAANSTSYRISHSMKLVRICAALNPTFNAQQVSPSE